MIYGGSASVQAVTRVNAEQALYGAFIVKRFQSSDLSFLLSRSVSLFDVESRFFAPTRSIAKPARAELSRLAVTPTLRRTPALPGHTLTASSTTAGLMRSGRRSEGSLPIGRGSSRHNLVFGRSIAT